MTKKATIFGLSLALLASTVVGVFQVNAQDSYWPNNSLTCSPSTQSATSGQLVTFTATQNYPYYQNQYQNQSYPYQQLTWTAIGGTPSSGYGSTFSTRFYTSSTNQTSLVSVTDGHQTATCTVFVNGNGYPYPTPTWTPYPYPYPTPYQYLQCSPSYTSVNSGDTVSLSAFGGNGTYSWNAQDGTPSTGYGPTFSTRYYNNGWNGYNTNSYNYYNNPMVTKTVTVTSGGQSATCSVTVRSGYPYVTPTPSPSYNNYVTMDHSVTNLTTNQAVTSPSGVTASNGDRLRFTVTVNTNGYGYVSNLRVQDVLPAYVGYVPGTTRVNGATYADGITGGGITLNTGVYASGCNQYQYPNTNCYNSNRTYTVTLDAQVLYNPYSTQTLANYVYLTGDGINTITKTTRVYVNGYGYGNPTPYPTPYYGVNNGLMSLTVAGRNVSRGQVSEYSTIGVRANETVDIILHVRAAAGQYLTNVVVTNYLPSGLNYVTGSTTINGVVAADGITSSGLSIGSLNPGQEMVVKLSAIADATVTPTWGVTSVMDSVQVRADNVGTVSGQMQINFGDTSVLTTIGNVKTGPADSLLIAFALAALASGLYAAYTQTDRFGRRIAATEIKRLAGRGMNFSR